MKVQVRHGMSPENVSSDFVVQDLHDFRGAIGFIRETASAPSSLENTDLLPMAVYYEHALSCLCLSWHHRWMTLSVIDQIDDDQFRTLCRSVPKWDYRLEIVDLDRDVEPVYPVVSGDASGNAVSAEKALESSLSIAERILCLAKRGGELHDFDKHSIPLYGNLLISLCRAWSAWLRPNKRNAYADCSHKTEERIAVPNWGTVIPLYLVPLGWRLSTN